MRSSSLRPLRGSSWVGLCALVACAAAVGCGSDDDDDAGSGSDAGGTLDGGSVSPPRDGGGAADVTVVDGSSTGGDGGTATESGADGGGNDASQDDGSRDAGEDAADATDAADAADATPPPLAGRAGTVLFSQLRVGSDVGKTAAASFAQVGSYADAGSAGTPECAAQTINAACTFTLCTPLAVHGGAPPVPSQAGVVTVSGGTGFPAGGVVLTPDVADSYTVTAPASFDDTTVYMKAGDTLTYAAAGDATAIGPFRVSVLAPADVAVTAPVVTASGGENTTRIALSSDVTVSWAGGQPGSSVLVTFSTLTEANDSEKIVECTFPAEAGSGVVPSVNGLAKLDVTNATTVNGSFVVTPQSSAAVTAGNAGGSAAASDAWLVTATAAGTPQTSELTTTP